MRTYTFIVCVCVRVRARISMAGKSRHTRITACFASNPTLDYGLFCTKFILPLISYIKINELRFGAVLAN